MKRHLKKRSEKTGLPPGSLVYIGPKKSETVNISLFDYTVTEIEERLLITPEESSEFKNKNSITWINIDGIHQIEVLKTFGQLFELHPLMLEDIANSEQRPKVDYYGDQVFIVLKMLSYDQEHEAIESEQLSLVLTANFTLSFQEKPGDVFDPIRERIRSAKSRIRKESVDYLVYSLIDTVVDNYFSVLEALSNRLELLSEEMIKNPKPIILHKLHHLKRQILFVRKCVWPLRDLLGTLTKEKPALFKESTLLYLRDIYDHSIQIIDTIESFREMLASMVDIYLSNINIKTNDIMKVLTIITTIFIPLNFIAGIYGMNFDYMPELTWRWGYPVTLSIMAVSVIGMLWLFRKKKWM